MNNPMILTNQAEYLESSLASALVSLAHFDSLVAASSLSFSAQQSVHQLVFRFNAISDELANEFQFKVL